MKKIDEISKELDWIQKLNDLIKERLEDFKKKFAELERQEKEE
jgi:DNA gyrase/topoisomerase IV subunit A